MRPTGILFRVLVKIPSGGKKDRVLTGAGLCGGDIPFSATDNMVKNS